MTQARFAIVLEDQTTGAANDAARALENLKNKIDADTRALREMEQAMRRLNSGAVVDIGARNALRDRILAQKAAIGEAQAQYINLGGTFRRSFVPQAESAERGMNRLLKAGKNLPGPLRGIAFALDDLKDIMGAGAFAGPLFLAAAAIAAITVGAIAGTAALVSYAVSQANARRDERLRLEGLIALDEAQRDVSGSASQLQSVISRVSASSALGRGDIESYASELYKAKLRGDDFADALEAMTIVGSVQGDSQAREFLKQVKAAQRAGRSVRELSNDVRTRLGGIAARQTASLSVQAAKLQESLTELFSGLDIEGFLTGLREITSLLSQSTATGRAMKVLVEEVFQPLIDSVAAAMPLIKRFFQGLTIGALIMAIAFFKVRNAWREAFGDSDFLSSADLMTAALWAGVGVAAALAAGLTLLAAVFVPVAAGATMTANAISGVMDKFGELYDWLQAIDWSSIGSRLADGLVNGIRSSTERVTGAVRDLASSATSALREALGIQSPSRVFAELGLQIPRGLAQGVERGADNVNASVADVVSVPEAPRRAGNSVNMGGITLVVQVQSNDPESIGEAIREKVAEIFEGIAIEMGAEPV